ncbi:hypothetical protein [Iodobacter fluviatilis]|uniref:Uncharacterized protein n=1 Tax=Iodobacter fluviatilis TaxID=537 RepID=A0A7G3G9R9_9NEIS|nr:hypothetical protein [Iodobacter fluviatilis]QBC43823.1 hypothetical protein C1H71_09865 [Iodobacter fluviatilis]
MAQRLLRKVMIVDLYNKESWWLLAHTMMLSACLRGKSAQRSSWHGGFGGGVPFRRHKPRDSKPVFRHEHAVLFWLEDGFCSGHALGESD